VAGRLVHFELPAQDAARARGFWSGLFGWKFGDPAMPDLDYRMVQTGPEQGGAVFPSDGSMRGPVVYFDTEDIDASVAKARELGGSAEDKQPIPGVGWFARCKDTEGNEFSLFQSDESVQMPS
jgi:predicted enzyme related to lactoylglutathione lyase